MLPCQPLRQPLLHLQLWLRLHQHRQHRHLLPLCLRSQHRRLWRLHRIRSPPRMCPSLKAYHPRRRPLLNLPPSPSPLRPPCRPPRWLASSPPAPSPDACRHSPRSQLRTYKSHSVTSRSSKCPSLFLPTLTFAFTVMTMKTTRRRTTRAADSPLPPWPLPRPRCRPLPRSPLLPPHILARHRRPP